MRPPRKDQPSKAGKRALIYVRASVRDPHWGEYFGEYFIACRVRAAELDARVVQEFSDWGERRRSPWLLRPVSLFDHAPQAAYSVDLALSVQKAIVPVEVDDVVQDVTS